MQTLNLDTRQTKTNNIPPAWNQIYVRTGGRREINEGGNIVLSPNLTLSVWKSLQQPTSSSSSELTAALHEFTFPQKIEGKKKKKKASKEEKICKLDFHDNGKRNKIPAV